MSGTDTPPGSGLSAREYSSAWAAAEAAFDVGDLAAARDRASDIAERSAEHGLERRYGLAHRLLGRIAYARGDVTSAESAFGTALRAFTVIGDDNAAAAVLTDLAKLRLTDREFVKAAELSRQAVRRAPSDVHALTVLGYAQWLGGSPADGEITFEQALYISHDAVSALAGRGQVRADLGDHRDALTDLDRALTMGVPPEEEPDVRSARALALAGLGELADADEEITRAVALDPARARTRLRRGRIRTLSGRVEEAFRDFQEVLTVKLAPIEETTARRTLARLRTR